MQVLKPRDLKKVEESVIRQAALMGEKAMYGWGAGKGRVEGLSIRMAMIMFNAYGNMTVVAEPVQETAEAWIFTHYIVDLETGASAPRQWRESKRSKVDGNLDTERKDQIRFNRGQSKNIRNVVLNKMPYWLTQRVLEEAKKGVKKKLQDFIDSKGIAAAQTYAVEQLKRVGVSEEAILHKMGKAEVKGLDLDDLMALSADLNAIQSGEEHASTLFPPTEAPAKLDLTSKLKAQLDAAPAPKAKKDAEAVALNALKVQPGNKPFSWLVNDGTREHSVVQDPMHEDQRLCDCTKPPSQSWAHVQAVIKFEAGA
jgi:hypothetical protein